MKTVHLKNEDGLRFFELLCVSKMKTSLSTRYRQHVGDERFARLLGGS